MYFISSLSVLMVFQTGMITLDNASNNNTMMSSVGYELAELDILFDVVGNRIQYSLSPLKIGIHLLINSKVLPSRRQHRRQDWSQVFHVHLRL